ncbi:MULTISPECIES: hypothetical protein [unclassified Legionella]|uniref:hypothetical protein n=1 Tax=unclassified Legionella TaxID=2622702 RepID=UPI00105530FD|nr:MULTISPECIES: hypothetical protein [unclassified Legionella]MDI9818334.1 hypothetical protein [Legionella sp. PL877]
MEFNVSIITTPSHLKDIQSLLNQGIQLYKTHHELGGHLSEIPSASYNQQLKTAKRLFEEHDNNASIRRMTEISIRDTMRSNFLELNEKLRDHQTWRSMSANAPVNQQPTIDRLWREWQRHAAHSHFTAGALFHNEALLQELLALIQLAKDEFNKKKYKNKEEFSNYQQYLAKFEQQIQDERQQIAEALYYRIKVAFTNNSLIHYNPVCALLNKLQAHRIQAYQNLKANEFISSPAETLPLAKAVNYIMTYGTDELRAALLPYFSLEPNNPDFSLKSHQQGNHFFLVPLELSQYLPKTSKWFMWLFPGYHLRYHFFHDKTELLFKLAVLNSSKAPIQGIVDMQNPFWLNLETLQNALEEEHQSTNKKNRNWFGFLFETTNDLLNGWKNLIQRQQKMLIRHQISYLEQMVKAPLPLEYAFQNNSEHFIERKQAMLLSLEKLEARFNAQDFTSEERTSFQTTKQNIIKKWNLGEFKESTASIDAALFHLSQSTSPLPMDKFNSLETELMLKNDKELDRLIADKALMDIISRMQEALEELPSLIQPPKAIGDELLYLYQTARLLSFLYKTDFKLSPAVQALRVKLNEFLLEYQKLVKGQTQDHLLQRKEDFLLLEETIHTLISIHPDWKEEQKCLFQASGFRQDIMQGYTPVDVEKVLMETKKERLEQTKQIEDMDKIVHAALRSVEEGAKILENRKNTHIKRKKELAIIRSELENLGIFSRKGQPNQSRKTSVALPAATNIHTRNEHPGDKQVMVN